MLYNYYIQSKLYDKAAMIMLELSHQEDITFTERLTRLSNALRDSKISLTTQNNSEFNEEKVNELNDILDIAHLQYELILTFKNIIPKLSNRNQDTLNQYNKIINELEKRILPVSDLYNNYACKYKYHDICLLILQSCNMNDSELIETHWNKYLNLPPQPSIEYIFYYLLFIDI